MISYSLAKLFSRQIFVLYSNNFHLIYRTILKAVSFCMGRSIGDKLCAQLSWDTFPAFPFNPPGGGGN